MKERIGEHEQPEAPEVPAGLPSGEVHPADGREAFLAPDGVPTTKVLSGD